MIEIKRYSELNGISNLSGFELEIHNKTLFIKTYKDIPYNTTPESSIVGNLDISVIPLRTIIECLKGFGFNIELELPQITRMEWLKKYGKESDFINLIRLMSCYENVDNDICKPSQCKGCVSDKLNDLVDDDIGVDL